MYYLDHQAEHFYEFILKEAMKKNATDIHFLPHLTKVRIFFRVLGERVPFLTINKNQYDGLLAYFKFMSGMDIGENRRPQNGKLEVPFLKQKLNLRLSTLPIDDSESLAIRILPYENVMLLEDLFYFPTQAHTLLDWVRNPFGIILFTGPTGSGKSTTMYALLQTIMKEKPYQIITLEDPIEQHIDHILQIQVNEKAGINYDAGLKAALRHDPDILMVGEIRDETTAQFAFRAAYTGHLVLSTIHAKNAFGTIFRLQEMGISKTDLSQSLIGIASQQLIPHPKGRKAIIELLDGDLLTAAIQGQSPYENKHFQSFDKLRKKAFTVDYEHSLSWTEKNYTTS